MLVGTVSAIWRHPVKSMQGELVSVGLVTAAGLAGDRRWAVLDVARARVLSARREPRLLHATARPVGANSVLVALPDGTEVTPGPQADAALQHWLDRDVRLVAAPPGRLGFVDEAPLHLLSESSVAATGADVRRFRPTLLLRLAAAEPAELAERTWAGRRLRIGSAVVTVTGPCARCAITTHSQPGLDRDRSVFATLIRHHGLELGAYAGVEAPGSVATGDPVLPAG